MIRSPGRFRLSLAGLFSGDEIRCRCRPSPSPTPFTSCVAGSRHRPFRLRPTSAPEPVAARLRACRHRRQVRLLGLPELDALLFITHDLDLALRFTQRVLLLKEGHLVADGPPLQVLADPALLEACNLRPTSLLHYLLAERNAVA